MPKPYTLYDASNDIFSISTNLTSVGAIIEVVKDSILDDPADNNHIDRWHSTLCGAAALLREIHKEMERVSENAHPSPPSPS